MGGRPDVVAPAPAGPLTVRRLATPLLAVLVLVEVTDVVFAVDSIPAIFAVTDEAFLVFTANAFAIVGLRAMYFLLADLVHRFVHLKLGLALVLMWVGVKMLLKIDVLHVPTTVSLAVVVTVLAASIGLSLWAIRGQERHALEAPTDPPFRSATAQELAEVEPLWRRRRVPAPHPVPAVPAQDVPAQQVPVQLVPARVPDAGPTSGTSGGTEHTGGSA